MASYTEEKKRVNRKTGQTRTDTRTIWRNRQTGRNNGEHTKWDLPSNWVGTPCP